MTYENIKFAKANMTCDSGYFYTMDDGFDAILQKVDDGDTAFSYPLDVPISSAVTSLEFDGINFWSMQNITGGVTIKRWHLENNICWLEATFNLTPNYTSDTFTIEHYHTTLSVTASGGDTTIQPTSYYDTVIISGSILTLGPNSSNEYEEVTVTAVSGTVVTLSAGITNTYAAGNNINFYNNLWVFNSNSTGSLVKINSRTGAVITTYSAVEYDNITACTFAKVDYVTTVVVDALVYVKDQNLKYLNVNSMVLYGTMTIDNLIPPSMTIIIYDLAIVDTNIYRLQDRMRYFGTTYTWSTYNYALSTVKRFIDTVNVSAYPLILPADGVGTAEITAIVNDQYGAGVVNKPVSFTDDDPIGFITINPVYTDSLFGTGVAKTYYKAGITFRTVTVQGTATQYD
jgi:hypothetical protein